MKSLSRWAAVAAVTICASACALAQSPATAPAAAMPWMNTSLSPAQRADLVLKQMTLDEKILLMHGNGMPHVPDWQMPLTKDANGGAGYIPPIPRLGLPAIDMSDAAYGVRSSGENGRYSTALPSDLGAASSWDVNAACDYGALIGYELRAQGYNMTLGGGVNLAREPRDGRTFEYQGEDPLLAGTMVGNRIRCEGAQHVISDIKHYAMNDQETGRTVVSSDITVPAMRESDLLAFQIGIEVGHPNAVMCGYNLVNNAYDCQNDYLLRETLKGDWQFPGFVDSDWGATHSTVASSHAGLDHEEPLDTYYGSALKKAVEAGQVTMPELDEHVRRILGAYFASGVVDYPVQRSVITVLRDLAIAQKIEEGSIVLFRNEHNILPLDPAKLKTIAMIGSHADVGMLSGGGSAQVDPPGGNAILPPGQGATRWQEHIWFPTSPLQQLMIAMPSAKISYNPGTDPAASAEAAKGADVAIVFVHQWESEGMDLKTLALPENQDAIVDAVAAANPHTVVVLETGTAALMPWADKVDGIVEAWYGGSSGAEALAQVLTGAVNPSGKTAITFPISDAELPHPVIPPLPAAAASAGVDAVNADSNAGKVQYSVDYTEGAKVGYKYYEAGHKPVLFPFGFGLSYTTFRYSGLHVTPGQPTTVTFTVENTGKRAGAEIAEVYAMLPQAVAASPQQLVGFDKVMLQPGERRQLTVSVNPLALSVYDEAHHMHIAAGDYTFAVGGSSASEPLKQTVTLAAEDVSR